MSALGPYPHPKFDPHPETRGESVFVNIIWLIGFAVLATALGWLVWRAWHASNSIVKWGGAAGSGFLTLVFALVTVLVLVSAFKTYLPRGNPVVEISIEGTSEQIARGTHLANTVCAACHTVNDELPSPVAKIS